MSDKHEWIAARAYRLWEQDGRPDGRDHEHWQQASDAWLAENPDLGPTPPPVHDDWDEESEE